jgi:ATP-dependent exoDNAse (exonuclease V) beta subunit
MADLFVMPSALPVERNDRRPPDWEAREQALDVRQSWIVEAPAGSGKTGLLIQRYLKLLAEESVERPEQVLAITFTVKATAEIRERVMGHLESAARGEALKRDSEVERETRALAEAVLQRDRALGWGLLDDPRRLRVRTIDSVCAEIARSLPVLSEGASGWAPVNDASPLYREAARRTLMLLGGDDAELNDALRTVLLHRDGSLGDCERLLAEMLQLRDQWGEIVPRWREYLDDAYLDGTVLPWLESTLERAVCAGLTEFAGAMPENFLREVASLAASLAGNVPHGRDRSPVAVCAGRVGIPGTDAAALEQWRALIHLMVTPSSGQWRRGFAKSTMGFEMTAAEKASLRALLEQVAGRDDLLRAIERVNRLPPARYPQEQWVVAKALFRVLSRGLVELQLVFAERGECDFAELALLAKGALRREGGVEALVLAAGFELRHLLVDEMQDTSTGQYELVELLTQGWDGRSQTVFLVGDPKQSIYLFRQARVERFVRTMQTGRLGELPVGCLRLTANFRSQRELVEAFNEDFSLLFPREVDAASPEEVPYAPAVAVNGPSGVAATRGFVWHTEVLAAGEGVQGKRRVAKQTARMVREVAAEWRARPLPEGRSNPWKIAVLVRSRNHLIDVVSELKREVGGGAIPFRAVDIEKLDERQEVLDLFALTRALLHPADRTAWMAMLRAPWCGLELADLHVLTGADDDSWKEWTVEDLMTERGHLLSEESCARLQRIWPVLRAAEQQRSRLTMAQWVERTWRSLGGDAYLTAEEMGNARRYLELMDEMEESGGGIDLTLLKRRLNGLFAEAAMCAGAVDLMTIHGAKGLEWDVVIVPGLEKKAAGNKGRLLTWSEIGDADGDAAHVLLAPIAGKGEESKELNAWLKGIHDAREAAERKRLFYVACTRAREELHLFAAPEAKADGSVSRAAGSLLAAAWPAAERHFAVARTEVLTMPGVPVVAAEFVGDLAAGGVERAGARLQRLPLRFVAGDRFAGVRRLSYGEAEVSSVLARFERPEGSFEARVFGNAVHAFVEVLTRRLAAGEQADALLREVSGWGPRIAAVLRGDGLPVKTAGTLASRVKGALENILRDPHGLWVLGARQDGASEFALTSWEERHSSVRLDRVFRAGREPMVEGDECLWIVDYKTATHGLEGVEAFLAGERAKYAGQMKAYARVMRGEGEIRVGLYYPMLPRLIWWVPELD